MGGERRQKEKKTELGRPQFLNEEFTRNVGNCVPHRLKLGNCIHSKGWDLTMSYPAILQGYSQPNLTQKEGCQGYQYFSYCPEWVQALPWQGKPDASGLFGGVLLDPEPKEHDAPARKRCRIISGIPHSAPLSLDGGSCSCIRQVDYAEFRTSRN